MKPVTINGLTLFQFDIMAPFQELLHAITTRIGGISPPPFKSFNLGQNTGDSPENVKSNYKALSFALNFDLQAVVTSHQRHGTSIACIDSIPRRSKPFPDAHAFLGFDAFITAKAGIPLLVRVADCVPILLYEPVRKVLAVVHAGWKGTAGAIAVKTVIELIKSYQCAAGELRAGIGPSIGPCCYEVRSDTADRFRERFPYSRSFITEKCAGIFSLDLQKANWLQLLDAGLSAKHIEIASLCTACNLNFFFSHRGEQGKTGRFALIAGLRR